MVVGARQVEEAWHAQNALSAHQSIAAHGAYPGEEKLDTRAEELGYFHVEIRVKGLLLGYKG